MARWILAAGLLGTLITTPSGAAAEWFFRGTANGWAATAMVSTDGLNFDTCQFFQSGDASGGPRFKIDRYGNWQQSYPTADYAVTANTHYQIRIHAGTQAITTTAVASCEASGFARTLPQLQVRGTFNGWASLPMTLVADHLWQAEAYMDGKANQRLKFDQAGDWAINFGDSNTDGVLERSGGDILWSGTGMVRFQVNDETQAYSITPLGDDNQPPIAVITPGGTLNVAVGDALTLSGSDSTDPDGQIASYLWSSGETTESISVNTAQAGTFTYGLTVTDDQGAKSSSSVSLVVAAPQTGGSWYFRGTPNNWGLTAMTSEDGVTFCTEQAFGSSNPRFKIDRKGDWTEAYPAQDYKVSANTSYRICFDSQDKTLEVASLAGADNQAPTVTATPAPGSYAEAQSITLSVSDDNDSAPRVHFTTDGSQPTTASPRYAGQAIVASDKGSGTDLVIKTLSVDGTGNQGEQSFSYQIGETPVAGAIFVARASISC
ncbi:chitobiase/beta-hexosaminidase C-terminal domain-containing protein [Aeromonas rivipollensis]